MAEIALRLTPEVISRDWPKHLVIYVSKKVVNTPFLAEKDQHLEETGFTQNDVIALAVVLCAIPPPRRQSALLLAVAEGNTGAACADCTAAL